MIPKPKYGGTIHIISPGYNCESLVKFWYNSLKVQSYPYWKAYAIDDCSSDGTLNKLRSIQDDRLMVIHRDKHYYQLGNWNDLIRTLPKEDFVVRLDLDDWMGDKYILEKIIEQYLYRGSEVFTITEFPLSCYYKNDRSARWSNLPLLELITQKEFGDSLFAFKAKYFQNIPVEMFYEIGTTDFIRCSGDVAITPLIMFQGWYKLQHLYFERGLMYNDVREPEYDDDQLKLEDGRRAHEFYNDLFLSRFRKLIKDGIVKTE